MKSLDSQKDDENLVLSSIISLLAHKSPNIEQLNREELKQVARAVVFDDLKEALAKRVLIEKIDYQSKKETFLNRYKKRSNSTYIAYRKALDALESWCQRSGKHVLELNASYADSFIDSLNGSSSSVRLITAACSSFFTFLERETENRIQNPFRGTKARPKKRTKEPEVPSFEEIELIKQNVNPIVRVAITVMTEHGLRVGGLCNMTVRAGVYHIVSKGKDISGKLSNASLQAIQEADLDMKHPFMDLKKDTIQNAFKYAVGKLYKEGKLRAKYSVHDLRHFFAVSEYKKNKDIYKLKVLLGHSTIQVTELYLKGLERYIWYNININ